jgi:PAS domain S-box-containing protein
MNTRTQTAPTNAEAAQPAEVFERAFHASVNGITVYEAIRNEQGKIGDFRFVMINEAGLRMSGYTREELLGKSVWQIYPATKINGLFDRYVQVCETGQPFSGEHYYPEYDIWREVSIVPVQGGIMLTYNDTTARKKMEETATKQAQLLHGILEGVPVGIAVLKAVRSGNGVDDRIIDFHVVRTNSVLQAMICPPGQDCSHPLLTEAFEMVSESGLLSHCILGVELSQLQEFDMPYSMKGTPAWYRVSMVPEGEQVILALTDITATKEAQLAHHFQAELLQTISNNTPAGMVLWEAVRDNTPQRTITDFCYRMSNLMNSFVTGHSTEYLLGKDLLATFPRFRGTELETVLHEVTQTGRSQRMIFTYYTDRPDGWFEAQFVRVRDGVLMTFVDVTEQHKAQLAQKEQANMIQAVVNAQPAGIFLYEPVREETTDGKPGRTVDYRLKLINATGATILNNSVAKLLDARFLELLPGPETEVIFGLMNEVVETGITKNLLIPYFANGIRGWFQSTIVRCGNQILCTVLDVSDLKLQQQTLELANLELHRSNDNLQQFAYIASHDLQEPLRKIMSFGDIIAERYETVLDEMGRDMISRMQTSAERMSVLIKDLLNYSRITTHRTPFVAIDLSELLTGVVGDLFVAINESGALVEWDELPVLLGDQRQLQQLFQNLLSNAIKFRQKGVTPRIKISTRIIRVDEMPTYIVGKSLSMDTKNDGREQLFHEICVADNGIGFDEKYLDRIFQVFQRLHGKANYAGTGVGLAICRKVAENHQGLLTATSQLNIGSTFMLFLPVGEE